MSGTKPHFTPPSGLRFLSAVLLPIAIAGTAGAVIIASDDFTVPPAGGGGYVAGDINGQGPTLGTVGYYTGPASGNSVSGWVSGTGAFSATTGGSIHPLSPNPPPSTNEGRMATSGNGAVRIQYRDFASPTAPPSNDYYFSAILRQSSTSYTGTTSIGISDSRAGGANATIPNTGFMVGFVNGGISLFYGNGTTTFGTTNLLAAANALASHSYLAVVHYNAVSGTITPMLYNASGTLINNPTAQTTSATITAANLGAFTAFVDAGFVGGGVTAVSYDQLRFGTELSDVMIIPEPSVSLLALGGLGTLALRRRRTPR